MFRRADRGNFSPAVRRKCGNKLENSSLLPIIWICRKVHDEGPRQDKATQIQSESGHSTRRRLLMAGHSTKPVKTNDGFMLLTDDLHAAKHENKVSNLTE